MSNLLPKSRLIKVEMTIALPASATMDQVEEWVKFEARGGAMDGGNPLGDYDMEAISAPVLTDTRRHLHEEVIDNQDGTHKIKRWTDTMPSWGPRAIQTIIAKSR